MRKLNTPFNREFPLVCQIPGKAIMNFTSVRGSKSAPPTKAHPPEQLPQVSPAWPLAYLTLLPLAVIVFQLAVGLDGVCGYSLYKLFMLVPPLVYCRLHGVGVVRDVLKPGNWSRHLSTALAMGAVCGAVFLGAYFFAADWLVDRSVLVERIGSQFSVTAATVLVIAPLTIFLNSLLEEFFYRGFAFGLLVKKRAVLGYLLPAAAFTLQHLLFINQWLAPWLLAIAGAALFVFALALERLYIKADTIVAPWLAHILADVAMMTIALTLLW